MRFTVAAAQIPQSDDPEENCHEITALIDAAPANIICFPETSLSGAITGAALTPFHERIARVAHDAGKWVIYGAHRGLNGMTFNEAYVVGPGGLAATYRKHHLWHEDGVTPGAFAQRAVKTDFGKIGVVICWDAAFPEITRSLVHDGADVIFCPAYWYGEKYGTSLVISELPLVRAFEDQCFFVLADAYTPDTAKASRICSPTRVLAVAGQVLHGVIVAEVDTDELERSRAIFDCWPRR